nr:hypothetical protein [Haliscomenobacter sp.]
MGRYVGVEFNYLKNQYKDIWYFGVANIYADSTSFNNYPRHFWGKKQTFSFNFKFGPSGDRKRLAFDYYVGFGLKYRDVTHFDRINPSDEMEIPRHPNVHYFKNLEGKSWTVSIPLNSGLDGHFDQHHANSSTPQQPKISRRRFPYHCFKVLVESRFRIKPTLKSQCQE